MTFTIIENHSITSSDQKFVSIVLQLDFKGARRSNRRIWRRWSHAEVWQWSDQGWALNMIRVWITCKRQGSWPSRFTRDTGYLQARTFPSPQLSDFSTNSSLHDFRVRSDLIIRGWIQFILSREGPLAQLEERRLFTLAALWLTNLSEHVTHWGDMKPERRFRSVYFGSSKCYRAK